MFEEKIKGEKPIENIEEQTQNNNQTYDENCLFCNIANKKIDSFIIKETENYVAFLDITPSSLGQTIFIPKQHIPFSPLIRQKDLEEIAVDIKRLSSLFLKKLKSRGTSVFIANGSKAGQRLSHVSIHVIPRYIDDEVELNVQKNKLSEEELQEVFSKFNRNK